jgi:uncharacterized SAM-binding protein YcdF (DUF218 family)
MKMFLSFRRRIGSLVLTVLLLVALYLCRDWLLPPVAHFLDISEPARSADAVYVLGGGVNDRPFVGADLVRKGLAQRVLVSTVRLSPENEDGLWPPEHELTRQILLACGVADNRVVLLPGTCASTEDEARALARYLDEHPTTRVAIVTHGYHTRRARRLFCRVLGEQIGLVYFLAAPTDAFSANDWWQSEEGFTTYATEYVKFVMSFLR